MKRAPGVSKRDAEPDVYGTRSMRQRLQSIWDSRFLGTRFNEVKDDKRAVARIVIARDEHLSKLQREGRAFGHRAVKRARRRSK